MDLIVFFIVGTISSIVILFLFLVSIFRSVKNDNNEMHKEIKKIQETLDKKLK